MGVIADAIAAAFNDVAAEIPEVIKTAELVRRSALGQYVPEEGAFVAPVEDRWPCRYFETTDRPLRDLLAPYVVGPSEVVAIVQGLEVAPREGDALDGRTIRAVGNVYGSGEAYVVAMA